MKNLSTAMKYCKLGPLTISAIYVLAVKYMHVQNAVQNIIILSFLYGRI